MTGAYLGRNITGDVMVTDSKSAKAKLKSSITVSCSQFLSVLSKRIDGLHLKVITLFRFGSGKGYKNRLSHFKSTYYSWILHLWLITWHNLVF